MDQFFQDAFHGGVDDDLPIFWCDYSLPVNRSAFVPYTNAAINEAGLKNSCINVPNSGNMNKRMIGFLSRSWPVKMVAQEPERERLLRHMMNERMRRERQKQSYLALHSMLPPGTRNDKNSIVQTATKRIAELKSYKQVLERRNHELLTKLAAIEEQKNERTKIKVKVSNPRSGVDSMLEVFKCLKKLGVKTTSIQSKFTNQELIAVVDIETEIDAREVEKAAQRTLQEVERKLL